ncbi:MAG: leucine-rich repeat protein [Clostridia bacterium]|nr:leucine-rich repeat protein [Clostridia bacterium]
MKKTSKMFFCLFLSLLLAAQSAFCLTALAEPAGAVASGFCGGDEGGENLAWTLTDDGVLTVTGEGATGEYAPESPAPYAAYAEEITGAVIAEGVTRLGAYALGGLENLSVISLPATLISAGELVLDGCMALTEICYAGTCGEMLGIEMPEDFGRTGVAGDGVENSIYEIIHCAPTVWESPQWAVEDGVLTVWDGTEIPDTFVYGNTPWFSLRDEITEVRVEEGVEYIGTFAFAGLTKMRELYLPSTFTGAGDCTLTNCVSLEAIYYDGTWEDLYTLAENGNIGELDVPETVLENVGESILHVNGSDVFADVDWTLENGVLRISYDGVLPVVRVGDSVMYQLAPWYSSRRWIHTIIVEEGVTGLDDYAFAGMSYLQELYLPATLTSVGEAFYQDCESLFAIYCAFDEAQAEQLGLFDHPRMTVDHDLDPVICLGENVRRFTYGEFSFIAGDARTLLTGYSGHAEVCELPAAPVDENGDTLDTYEIAPWAMRETPSVWESASYSDDEGNITQYDSIAEQKYCVRSLVIPDCVKVIRPSAFMYMNGLNDVSLPEGLTTIGSGAFAYSSLRSVFLPDSVVNFGTNIFEHANMSEGVRFPAGIETIPTGMFTWSSISSVTIPDTVKTIGREAFGNCRNLTSVTFSDGLEVIDDEAFHSTKLSAVSFPDSVKRIGKECFEFCHRLESVDWPADLERIGFCCFRYCTGLKEVILPDGVKYIEQGAFRECAALETVVLPEGVDFAEGIRTDPYTGETVSYPVHGVFAFDTSLKEVVLPQSVTDVGSSMFAGCTSLERVVFGENVEYIGPWTFSGCTSLKEIFLPASVKYLGLSLNDSQFSWARYYTVFGSSGDDTPVQYTGDIYFAGTPEQWAGIDAPKDDLGGATLHYPELRSKAATCTEEGYTDRLMYTDSDYVIAPGSVVPASGHDYAAAISLPTCTAQGYTTYTCKSCGDSYVADRKPLIPHQTVEVPESAPTATAHGYTAGVWCETCETWLSGHEVIHNTLGARQVISYPTEEEEGEAIITCTVCGESGVYAIEKLTPAEPAPDDGGEGQANDNSIIGRLRRAMQSLINWILRLIKWLGKK